jgi:uncharacterized protein YdcH (DUF465 family)
MQSLEKHTLLHDFPEHHDTINHLKIHNKKFEKLSAQYNNIAVELFKLEVNNSPVADEYLESLKMRRVKLKDQLFSLIQSNEHKT